MSGIGESIRDSQYGVGGWMGSAGPIIGTGVSHTLGRSGGATLAGGDKKRGGLVGDNMDWASGSS